MQAIEAISSLFTELNMGYPHLKLQQEMAILWHDAFKI